MRETVYDLMTPATYLKEHPLDRQVEELRKSVTKLEKQHSNYNKDGFVVGKVLDLGLTKTESYLPDKASKIENRLQQASLKLAVMKTEMS